MILSEIGLYPWDDCSTAPANPHFSPMHRKKEFGWLVRDFHSNMLLALPRQQLDPATDQKMQSTQAVFEMS